MKSDKRIMSDDEHGSPHDRGGADKYYGRSFNPHKYPNGTYNGDPVTNLNAEEIEAYKRGYNSQTSLKDWN